MLHYNKKQNNNALFIILILIFAVAWLHGIRLLNLIYIALGIIIFLIIFKLIHQIVKIKNENKFKKIDNLNGPEFEHYIAKLLSANGFHNVTLTEKYDFGVDIIAKKNGIIYGIQVKRYSNLVKASAIRQVVTGLKVYKCDQAMVITNSSYSNVAKQLAQANNCILIDRKRLNKLIQRKCII